MSYTHIPTGQSAKSIGDSTKLLRARGVKKKVLKVAETIKGFDQKDGVDLDSEKNRVTVKDQHAPITADKVVMAVAGNPLAAMPESVSGEASFSEEGQVKKVDATFKESLGSPQAIRYLEKEDGTTVYSAPDMLGPITVLEKDNEPLLIATGKTAEEQFALFAADDFQLPEAPEQTGEKKEGFSRVIPSSVGSVDLSETTEKASAALHQGSKKLGDWLSDISQNVKETAASVQESVQTSREQTTSTEPSTKTEQGVDDQPRTPTEKSQTPEWKPRVTKDNLAEKAKDPVGLVTDGLADFGGAAKSLFGGLFGKKG